MPSHRASPRRRPLAATSPDADLRPRADPIARLAVVLRTTDSKWWEINAADVDLFRQGAAAGEPVWLSRPAPAQPAEGPVFPADARRVAAFLAGLTRAALPKAIDFRVGSDRAPRWSRLSVVQRTGSGRTRRYAGLLTDISPIKRLENDILQVDERVKNRIGQELHDDLCQVLAGLSCLTRVLENRIAPKLPEEISNLRELNHQLVEAMDRTRALTHGLYPARMKSGDARAALLELTKEVTVRFGVKVRTAFRGRFPAHSPEEILQVYRIAQESISNALRHGRATEIDLALESGAQGMKLSVRDNGVGFPAKDTARHGIGLQTMRHRAAQIGARIQVGNAARHGAVVVLHYQPAARL